MTEVKASVKNFRSTPRKTRLIADLVRGKSVLRAVSELKFVNKRAAKGVLNLIQSAIANAKEKSLKPEELFIKTIRVDDGKALRRYRAGSHGRALPFKRRLSHINLVLAKKNEESSKKIKADNKKENKK